MARGRTALGIAAVAAGAFAALYVYARRRVRAFEDLDQETADAPGAFLQVNGTRVHYVEAGRGDPVVLVHGLGGSTFSFRYTVPELAQRHRVVAIDLRGFGYTERPEDADYSLSGQATLVQQAMGRLGIVRAAVVGHSMGGSVAMRLALQYPERVSRLVLVDAATDHEMRRGARTGRLLRPLQPILALATRNQAFRRFALRSVVHDPAFVTPEVIDGYFRPLRMNGTMRAFASLGAQRRRDAPLDPERIRQRTLVLWGEHDRLIPLARGEELARRIPNAQLEVIPGAAHLPLEEQPELSNKALEEFLRPPGPALRAPPEGDAEPRYSSLR
jgi:pimeloyl-ACP methyl ester carboxylesterase